MEILKIIIGTAFILFSYISNKLSFPTWAIYSSLGISYLVLSFEVLKETFEHISEGDLFDENFLMTVATIGAIVIGEYYEAVFVMLFYSVGEYLQDLAVDKSEKSIEELMNIKPSIARKKAGDDFVEVNPETIKTGDLIKVLPGEIIPVDGIVINGNAFVDTSSITGEYVPIRVGLDSLVTSGTIVKNSSLLIEATKDYENSTVSRILKLLKENQSKKAPTERFITRFAKTYTPIVCSLAIMLAVFPSLITGTWSIWIHRSLSFLVIACPCALGLSVPLAFFAGVGNCAKKGILVKGGSALEKLSKIELFCFDKTGTLTKGEFVVQEVNTKGNLSEDELLRLCLSLENESTHPISTSIVNYCKEKGIKPLKITNYCELPGKGLMADIEGKKCLVGNKKLLDENNVTVESFSTVFGTEVLIAYDGVFEGSVLISDTIKKEAKETISNLKKLGIKKNIILSGDNELSVSHVSEEVKADQYYFSLTPEDKVKMISKFENEGNCAFAGDGINDSPCLVNSYLGFSMGGIGSKATVEASDVVLMNDNLSLIPQAIFISRKTQRIAKQNIVFALTVKVICMVLGVLGVAGMEIAVFADTGVALIAVLNSLRALRNK